MLILTRKLGQSITIGESGNIKVTLLGIKGCQARIGITAPKEVMVHREEIFELIQAEASAATQDDQES